MLTKCEGIVLRTNDYGETNKIVTLLTREHGKIGVMARGAKKPNSRLSAVSQPFLYGSFLMQNIGPRNASAGGNDPQHERHQGRLVFNSICCLYC